MDNQSKYEVEKVQPVKIATLDKLFKKSKTVSSNNQMSNLEDLKQKIKQNYAEKYLLKKQRTAISQELQPRKIQAKS
jgi:hypothetical protein